MPRKRNEEAQLTLKAGVAERRLKVIETSLIEDLDLEDATDTIRMLARSAALLVLLSESMASQLNSGHAISVELVGRNNDRLSRLMAELRAVATTIRIKEKNAKALAALGADDDEEDAHPPRRTVPPRAQSAQRRGGIRRVVVDGGVERDV